MPDVGHPPPELVEFALEAASTSVAELDVPALLQRTCDTLSELYGLAGCAAVLLDSTGSVRAMLGSHPAAMQLTRLMREMDEDSALREYVVQDLTQSKRLDLAQAAGQVGLPISAMVALPGPTGLVGRLQLFAAEPGTVTLDLLAELRPFALLLGATLDNAEAYQHSASMVAKLADALDEQRPVEQAKGMLTERHQVDLDAAYRMLREQARRHATSVRAVASELVNQSWRAAKPVPEQAATPAPEQDGSLTRPS